MVMGDRDHKQFLELEVLGHARQVIPHLVRRADEMSGPLLSLSFWHVCVGAEFLARRFR